MFMHARSPRADTLAIDPRTGVRAARPAPENPQQTFVRDEMWAVAVDRFIAHGYEATTVEEIAAAAGVSRRTFFRHYSSKDDLMVKAIDTYTTC